MTFIDDTDAYSVEIGAVGFLIEKSHDLTGVTYYELRSRPAHTNQSNEPRLKGWCGTYNNVATYAQGLARVTKLCKNGRVQVVNLKPVDYPWALKSLGYPDLA